jgi:hypothetical protein
MRKRRPAAIASFAAALMAGLAVLAFPGTASAAKPCWEQVIDDWLANGTITGTYQVHCYRDALRHVPEDLRDYSNINDAINAALQARLRANANSSSGNSNNQNPGAPATSDENDNSSGKGKSRTLQAAPDKSAYRRAIDNLGTTSADSVPIPLIVLASLGALLLLSAAGMVGAKRFRASRAARGNTPPPGA